MTFGLEEMAAAAAVGRRARPENPPRHDHKLYIFLPCPSVCVCACVYVFAIAAACGSSQTDNHRGGRAKSERHECSVYWNKCKDRLQCQTGRASAPPLCVFDCPSCLCALIGILVSRVRECIQGRSWCAADLLSKPHLPPPTSHLL